MMIGSITFPIGFFLIGWTSNPNIFWFPSFVGFVFIGMSFLLIFQVSSAVSRLMPVGNHLSGRRVYRQVSICCRCQYVHPVDVWRRPATRCSAIIPQSRSELGVYTAGMSGGIAWRDAILVLPVRTSVSPEEALLTIVSAL